MGINVRLELFQNLRNRLLALLTNDTDQPKFPHQWIGVHTRFQNWRENMTEMGGLCGATPGTRTVARQENDLAAGNRTATNMIWWWRSKHATWPTYKTRQTASQFHNRGRPRLFVASCHKGPWLTVAHPKHAIGPITADRCEKYTNKYYSSRCKGSVTHCLGLVTPNISPPEKRKVSARGAIKAISGVPQSRPLMLGSGTHWLPEDFLSLIGQAASHRHRPFLI